MTNPFNKYRILSVAAVMILMNFSINAQSDQQVIAVVGDASITIGEFRNRFEMMPHIIGNEQNLDTLKKQFLYSLIAEKLWAQKAVDKGYDTSSTVKKSLSTLEKILIKDALYKSEIKNKIILSAGEIKTGLERINYLVEFKPVFYADSLSAFEYYTIQKSIQDPSTVKETNVSKTYIVSLGEIENEEFENELFSCNVNEFTRPVKTGNGWVVAKLINKTINPRSNDDPEVVYNFVVNTLNEAKEKLTAGHFIDSLLGGKSVSVNEKTFLLTTDEISKVLKSSSSRNILSPDDQFLLDDNCLSRLLNQLNKHELSSPLFTIDGNMIVLEDLIHYMFHNKIRFSGFEKEPVISGLRIYLKDYIEHEALAAKAKKRGFNKHLNVLNEMKIWRENYLTELALSSLADSISIGDTEFQNFINKVEGGESLQANISEIYSDDLTVIQKVLDKLSEGEEFEKLAEKYSINKNTGDKAGLGYFNIELVPEYSEIILRMKVGEIYGPIKIYNGYSVIKLLDLRQTDTILFSDDEKKLLREKLFLAKTDNLINSGTAKLAKQYPVSIDYQSFNELTVLPTQMFTVKLIGFGGKIAAFPMIIPLYDWVKQKDIQLEIP